jgi:uncharacterized protein with HEPN domain
MSPDVEELIDDSLRRALEIQEFVRGISFEDYQDDSKTKLAVERSFEIIGENLNRIKRFDRKVLDSIGDHRAIISFRNILAHAYDSVEDRIVWGIVISDLPKLIEDFRRVLKYPIG